jgi:hypothetical protein
MVQANHNLKPGSTEEFCNRIGGEADEISTITDMSWLLASILAVVWREAG